MDLPAGALWDISPGFCADARHRWRRRPACVAMSVSTVIDRYWHTVRWLKPVQVYGRLRFRLARARPSLAAAPQRRVAARDAWLSCSRSPTLVGPARLRLLGVERELGTAGDWNHGEYPRLWLYNAHYFDDLVADGHQERQVWHVQLIDRWIRENPPGYGTGWEPYPTSLRLVNWVKWMIGQTSVSDTVVHSAAVQSRALRQRLEHHLLGNHLWANAKALVFSGAFFTGPEAASWLRTGLDILSRELDEQVLADGGHFERSPMYHAIVAEDVLDLIQLSMMFPSVVPIELLSRLNDVIGRMLAWLSTMSHPDGGISFFNDAALGIAPDHQVLAVNAGALGVRVPTHAANHSTWLAASGFARLEMPTAVLLADVGSVGPSYLPGHAHAGTMSFELSVHGRRLLVNSGTSTYTPGLERHRQRGTAAHNTVMVDDADSSEVWGGFRVARRARVGEVRISKHGGEHVLTGSHDGYLRLPGRVTHHREWKLTTGRLTVTDTLEGQPRRAEARFHLAPGARLDWTVDGGEATLAPATWHPCFGESVPTQVLVVRFCGARASVSFRWD